MTRTLSRPHSHAHQDDTNDVTDEVEAGVGGDDSAENKADPDFAAGAGADNGNVGMGNEDGAAGCCLAVSHALSAAS